MEPAGDHFHGNRTVFGLPTSYRLFLELALYMNIIGNISKSARFKSDPDQIRMAQIWQYR